MSIEDHNGLRERATPRASFSPRDEHTRWDELHALYFAGYGMRRLDYAPDVLGSRPAAHFTEAHRTVAGLVFPTRRYVLRRFDEGRLGTEPTILVGLSDLAVEFGDNPPTSCGSSRTAAGGRPPRRCPSCSSTRTSARS
ncbi:hypothetical protein [Amycolatopsis sp. NPDC004169]|uniref:hypothetical protein n=1 Tax=Amycolatopsis sp. NPDC004169 TaxID=3154453 RepID=UPI0033AD05F5